MKVLFTKIYIMYRIESAYDHYGYAWVSEKKLSAFDVSLDLWPRFENPSLIRCENK